MCVALCLTVAWLEVRGTLAAVKKNNRARGFTVGAGLHLLCLNKFAMMKSSLVCGAIFFSIVFGNSIVSLS